MNKIRMIVEGDAYEKFSEFLELGAKANELGFKFKVEHVDYIPDKGEGIVKQFEEFARKASRERSERFLRHAMRFLRLRRRCRMNLTVIRAEDWVSVVDPVLGIGGAGKDYVEAFTAFGRSMHSHELTLKESIVEQESSTKDPDTSAV